MQKGGVMKIRNPKVFKKETYTREHRDCFYCTNNTKCVRCSSLTQDQRKIFLSLLGYRQKTTKAMKFGTKKHIQVYRHIKTLEKYGVKNFYRDLFLGKVIELKELNVCSCSLALRGHIDKLKIKYLGSNNFFMEITDLKSKFYKPYIRQLMAYAMILSDPNCRLIYKQRNKKKKISKHFYPNKSINVNIIGKLEFYKQNGSFSLPLVKNNVLHEMKGFMSKKLKEIRSFMNKGENYLYNIPMCKYCFMFDCSFWDICSRFDYKPTEKQKFLGKNKLLISHKPKLI